MPLIRLETNQDWGAQKSTELCRTLSRIAAEVIGKPEQYVQAVVHAGDRDHVTMLHAGTPGPAAFVDVRSIGGLAPRVTHALSERICALLAEAGVPAQRVYLNFTEVIGANWGHDGSTFG